MAKGTWKEVCSYTEGEMNFRIFEHPLLGKVKTAKPLRGDKT